MIGPGRKTGGGRPLSDWVEGCIAPALARFGFGEVDIVSGWPDIAGPRIAAFAEPVQIKWPRRGGTPKSVSADQQDPSGSGRPRPPATLVVRVEGVFALELQHLAPQLIERINAHLGWRCIGRIALRQAPLQGRPPVTRAPSPPAPRAVAAARDLTGGIDDEALRAALVRLGGRALTPR